MINTIESTLGNSVLPGINHEIPQYSKDSSRSTFNPSETTKKWDLPEKVCLHVISNSLSIPNRPDCLSDLIQTAKSSDFCPSVTRLLGQDNIKTKNERQHQSENKFFKLSIPFLYCFSKLCASKLT